MNEINQFILNELDKLQAILGIQPPPIQTISIGPGKTSITADVLRADLVHPHISGNKFYKLIGYLSAFRQGSYKGILSFGGAYSNHLAALAAACHLLEIPVTGIIRGEPPAETSPTLRQLTRYGMQLEFVSRARYAQSMIDPTSWKSTYPEYYIIPQGGEGLPGIRGAAHMVPAGRLQKYTHVFTAVGTGTTLAGILANAHTEQSITGISALKLPSAHHNSITEMIGCYLPDARYTLLTDYHFGGFAKATPALFEYMNDLYRRTGIPTDRVYTAKVFYGVEDLIRLQYLNASHQILIIHTGGLQGNQSVPPNVLSF